MTPAEPDRPADPPVPQHTTGPEPDADPSTGPAAGSRSAAESFGRQVDLLVNQVGHWTAPRWTAPAGSAGIRRSDLLHQLVQRLADLAADAEGQPRRGVPRLDNDLALPDQLRVVATDLALAAPPPAVLTEAVGELTATRQTL